MLKRVFCILLVLACLPSCALAKELDAHALLSGINWNIAPEELELFLGEEAVVLESSDPRYGMSKLLYVQDEDERISYDFFNDVLCQVEWLIEKDAVSEDVLIDRLSDIFGEEKEATDDYGLNDMVDGTDTLCVWNGEAALSARLFRAERGRGNYVFQVANITAMEMVQDILYGESE